MAKSNTKKRKVKYTKAKIAKLQESHRKHNKWAKANRMDDLILSFDDYLLYTRGEWKPKTTVKSTAKLPTLSKDKGPEYLSLIHISEPTRP